MGRDFRGCCQINYSTKFHAMVANLKWDSQRPQYDCICWLQKIIIIYNNNLRLFTSANNYCILLIKNKKREFNKNATKEI